MNGVTHRPVAAEWFERTVLGGNVVRFREPFVHEGFRANMFLVESSQRDMAVDFGNGLASLRQAFGAREKPLIAVATHAHSDHVGSFHEFSVRAGPRLEAAAFAAMADISTYADAFRTLAEPVSALPHPVWRACDYRLHPAPLTHPLEEGDALTLGDRTFHVIALPGHSPGSIGLLDRNSGTLFSGDAIHTGRLYDTLPDSDPAAYRRTMQTLLVLPVQVVHPGHGESFGREQMQAIAQAYLDGA